MKQIVRLSLLLTVSINGFIFSAADNTVVGQANKTKLGSHALKRFERSISLYERVAEQAGIPRDKGLANIYHGMHAEGIEQVAQDQSALQKAEELKKIVYADKMLRMLFVVCTEHLCMSERAVKQISLLAQKDILLAMTQRGFTLALPECDLGKLFTRRPDEGLVKEFLELNAEFPNTQEAIAFVRGALIMRHYLMQQCYKGRL